MRKFQVINIASVKELFIMLNQEYDDLFINNKDSIINKIKNEYDDIERGYYYALQMCYDAKAYEFFGIFGEMPIFEDCRLKTMEIINKLEEEQKIPKDSAIIRFVFGCDDQYDDQFTGGLDLPSLISFIRVLGYEYLHNVHEKDDVDRVLKYFKDRSYTEDRMYIYIGFDWFVNMCYKHNKPLLLNVVESQGIIDGNSETTRVCSNDIVVDAMLERMNEDTI